MIISTSNYSLSWSLQYLTFYWSSLLLGHDGRSIDCPSAKSSQWKKLFLVFSSFCQAEKYLCKLLPYLWSGSLASSQCYSISALELTFSSIPLLTLWSLSLTLFIFFFVSYVSEVDLLISDFFNIENDSSSHPLFFMKSRAWGFVTCYVSSATFYEVSFFCSSWLFSIYDLL